MPEILQPHVKLERSVWRDRFDRAEPFRHVVIDQFLDADFCQRLAEEFPQFSEKYARNEMGTSGGKAVRTDLPDLGASFRQLDRVLRSPGYLKLVADITGVANPLYDPDYVGGGTHENRDGQDLDAHVDFNFHPKRGWHRRLNQILFLNPDWQHDWGGILELHRDPWRTQSGPEKVEVLPLWNRCVFFETTETSWHGFRKITLPPDRPSATRRSIAVYFYTREAPEQGAAPGHATIYVPQPLPGHLQPGHTLNDQDREALDVLIARRDQQIQALYSRETRFTKLIGDLTSSASFRLGRVLTWPVRMVRGRAD